MDNPPGDLVVIVVAPAPRWEEQTRTGTTDPGISEPGPGEVRQGR